MCSGFEACLFLRLTDLCITQFQAQGPSRTCNESEGEEEGGLPLADCTDLRTQPFRVEGLVCSRLGFLGLCSRLGFLGLLA